MYLSLNTPQFFLRFHTYCESNDQDDRKFILLANYFCCHLESEYANAQNANVQIWILSVTQYYAMEWYRHFFKTLFECFDSHVPLDESFYL